MLKVVVSIIISLFALSASSPTLANDLKQDSDTLQVGRELTKFIYTCDASSLWPRMAPTAQKAVGSVEALRKVLSAAMKDAGSEKGLVDERASSDALYLRYFREAHYSKLKKTGVLSIVMDSQRRIAGFQLSPKQVEAKSPNLAYISTSNYILPFEDNWYVFWGGRSLYQNYHTAFKPQRFAYDFVVVKDGSTHSGDGVVNEEYYCYGMPIYASSQGTVIKVVDGIEDNRPSVMNGWKAAGNHVIIQHSKGEYSFTCHLQKGTIKVKKGDMVDPSTILGLCGNSGNSSEPHLHFHVQDTAILIWGNGIPVSFQGYSANNQHVKSGEPAQGEVITGTDRH